MFKNDLVTLHDRLRHDLAFKRDRSATNSFVFMVRRHAQPELANIYVIPFFYIINVKPFVIFHLKGKKHKMCPTFAAHKSDII